jgi:hypothetical protein
MSAKPLTNVSRWVTDRSECQTFGAITFIANRSGPAYAAPHPEEMTVEGLALAAGHLGQLRRLSAQGCSAVRKPPDPRYHPLTRRIGPSSDKAWIEAFTSDSQGDLDAEGQ